MNISTWKRHERKTGDRWGGKRVPVTGRQRGDAPDIEHPTLSIEVKSGRVLSTRMQTALQQADASVTGDKIPIVVLIHSHGRGKENERAVLLREDIALEVFRKAGLI